MTSDKCEHTEDGQCAIGTWEGSNSAMCALCGTRFVPEVEVQKLATQLLSVEGQCIEEHHWKGKCPAEEAVSTLQRVLDGLKRLNGRYGGLEDWAMTRMIYWVEENLESLKNGPEDRR